MSSRSEIHVSSDSTRVMILVDEDEISAVVETSTEIDERDVEQLLDDLRQELDHSRRVVGGIDS